MTPLVARSTITTSASLKRAISGVTAPLSFVPPEYLRLRPAKRKLLSGAGKQSALARSTTSYRSGPSTLASRLTCVHRRHYLRYLVNNRRAVRLQAENPAEQEFIQFPQSMIKGKSA